MNHNPHNLKVGDTVCLDYRDNVVKIIFLTPNALFAQVTRLDTPAGNSWPVMTNRLKPFTTTADPVKVTPEP